MIHGKPVATGHVKLGAIIGDHCRTGIHTCIAPGIKIGAGSLVNSNTLVSSDVPDNSFVKDGDVRPNRKQGGTPPDRKAFRAGLTGKGR